MGVFVILIIRWKGKCICHVHTWDAIHSFGCHTNRTTDRAYKIFR